MLVSIVTVGMVMKARKDDRAASRATGCSAKGILEEGPVLGEGIEVGGLQGGVAVGSEIRALIVGHEEYDVAFGGVRQTAPEHGGG